MTASVSVITVSYHTGPTLWVTIASVLQQPECLEMIVVNNGNMPGDEKRLNDWAAKELRLKILSGHGNVGFGKGNNLGVANASGDYVLLLNPDSMLPEGGLTKLHAEMAQQPENTLAGCYLINPDGSEQRGGRRALLTPENAMAESLGLSRFLKSADKLNYNNMPMPENTHAVPVISGAFMFLARSFYQRLKGFDEGYFLHMEDTDFCYRVHQAGGRVICVPSVKVLHFRSTSEVTSSFLEKHKAKGFVRYLNKFFASQYSLRFMKAMEYGIYARLWVKIILGKIDGLFISPQEGRREVAALALLYDQSRFSVQDNALAGKTILVAGATSQIGLYVIGRALARGANVVALHNRAHVAFTHPNLEWKRCNLTKPKNIAACKLIKADVLVYTAPIPLLTPLVAVLHNEVKRVIILGSGLPPGKEEAKVGDDLIQISGELQCNITVLNPLLPYGLGIDRHITSLASVIKRLGYVALYGKGKGLRNPVQVADVVEAVFAVVDNPQTYNKVYNLGGGSKVTYLEMIDQISAYVGAKARRINIFFLPGLLQILGKAFELDAVDEQMAKRMNRDISFDNSRAMEDFNYLPKAFLEGNITV